MKTAYSLLVNSLTIFYFLSVQIGHILSYKHLITLFIQTDPICMINIKLFIQTDPIFMINVSNI